MADHPVRIVVGGDDLQRRRLTVFFRLLLALPHLIVFGAFTFAGLLLAPVAWFIALIRGELPREIHDFYVLIVRYATRISAYVAFAAGPWPPFAAAGGYDVDVELAPPERHNRWTVGFRLVLALPAMLLVGALGGNGVTGAAVMYFAGAGILPTVAMLGWFTCLARGRMTPGMRDAAVYALGYTAQAYAYLLLLTPRYPDSDPGGFPAASFEHPVRMTLTGDDERRRHRLLVFFRLIVAVPHLVWSILWLAVVIVASVLGWLYALFAARLPRPLHRFFAAYVRYVAQLASFVTLTAEPFPGFTGANGLHPVAVEFPAEPERQGRWAIGFRALLAIPALMLSGALQAAQMMAALLGWWAALFTGRMPRGLRNLSAWSIRYTAQVNAYGLLLTPAYPYSGPGRCD